MNDVQGPVVIGSMAPKSVTRDPGREAVTLAGESYGWPTRFATSGTSPAEGRDAPAPSLAVTKPWNCSDWL